MTQALEEILSLVSRTAVFLIGILRVGVVTGSINVHKCTVTYFRWHLSLNLKVLKES